MISVHFRELMLRQTVFELGNIFSKSADLESNSAVISSVCELKGYSEVLLNKLMALCVFVALHKASGDWDRESILHWKKDFSISTFNSTWSQEKRSYEEDLSYCFHCCNTAWLLTREFSVMFTSSIKFVLCTVVGIAGDVWLCGPKEQICAGESVGSLIKPNLNLSASSSAFRHALSSRRARTLLSTTLSPMQRFSREHLAASLYFLRLSQ